MQEQKDVKHELDKIHRSLVFLGDVEPIDHTSHPENSYHFEQAEDLEAWYYVSDNIGSQDGEEICEEPDGWDVLFGDLNRVEHLLTRTFTLIARHKHDYHIH